MVENIPRKTDQVLAASLYTSDLTSETITSLLNCTKNQACNILNSLTRRGHLRKKQINFSPGGRYFIYNITNSGKKRVEWLQKNNRLDRKAVGETREFSPIPT